MVNFGNLQINTAGIGDKRDGHGLARHHGSPVAGASVWLDASAAATVLTNAGGSGDQLDRPERQREQF